MGASRHASAAAPAPGAGLYTPEQRRRRDATRWTLIQGLLAPVQFVAFAVSVTLIVRTLATGDGATAAAVSVVVKTGCLLAIMVTGAIWEKVVFGQYLFAPAFYWEDVFSMLVIALHVAYVVALLADIGDTSSQLTLALCGYAAYVVNATQFVLKLRAARIQERMQLATDVRGMA
ncbi:MAG: 2-vinyl bacteriochlorophyllide hydratase [Deltaproteobacteria bacterium]|nr:2-vinyl bacteriochlorophyllide hydratase [Nannocystaceae bacterium]